MLLIRNSHTPVNTKIRNLDFSKSKPIGLDSTVLLFQAEICPAIVQFMVLFALFIGLPAHAINYTFPGFIPLGCSGSNGIYSCGNLSIGLLDTITVTLPTTITVNGAFNTSAYSIVNSGKNASFLTFKVVGETNLGVGLLDYFMNANITTSGTPVAVAALEKVNGSISTGAGAVNIGNGSIIGGSIPTTAGIVNIGTTAQVTGSITTAAGGVNIGNNSTAEGLISTDAGVVTIDDSSVVKGTITTRDAAVNVGTGSQTGAISITNAGVASVGANSQVLGFIKTVSGAINIGDGSLINSCIFSSVAGATTLGINVIVGAGVFSYRALVTGTGIKIGGRRRYYGGCAITYGANTQVGTTASSSRCDDLLSVAVKPIRKIKSRQWRQIYMR